jgi:hypothetical protein
LIPPISGDFICAEGCNLCSWYYIGEELQTINYGDISVNGWRELNENEEDYLMPINELLPLTRKKREDGQGTN